MGVAELANGQVPVHLDSHIVFELDGQPLSGPFELDGQSLCAEPTPMQPSVESEEDDLYN